MRFCKIKKNKIRYLLTGIMIISFIIFIYLKSRIVNDILNTIRADMFSFSTTILSLSLTIVTILLALIDNEKISRLSKNKYLDNFMFLSKYCLYINIVIIILNYIFLILKKNKFEYLNIISSMDLSCFLGMIVAFTFLTKETLFLMKIVFRKKTNVNINVDSLRKKD